MDTSPPPPPEPPLPQSPLQSPSRVVKIPFAGRLSARALYVYLPAGYDEEQRRYPVLYMHDGQNVFAAHAEDAFAGTWRADETADRLIAEGGMQPCLIVGVSNGGEARLAEYLPPYSRYTPSPRKPRHVKRHKNKRPGLTPKPKPVPGRADETAAYYLEVAAFIREHYRVKAGRESAATCGSSLGGLFSTYLAWEHPDFARNHAAMSPSYWITEGDGLLETVERLKSLPRRDVRLWLDSGEGGEDTPGGDDDNKFVTLQAREALLEAGYAEGEDFVYHFEAGGTHSEASWAERLSLVLAFLFPPEPDDGPASAG